MSAEPDRGRERAQLQAQLAHLRAEFQEAVACYSLRVQGILAEVDDALAAEDAGKLSESELRAQRRGLHDALERVGAIKIKPARGRRRDLKAVEELARELRTALVDA